MVNSFADGKTKLVEPPYGSYVDSWQLPVNSNFGVTDASVSGTTTINVSAIPISTPFVTLVFQNFDTSPTPWQVPLAGQNLRIVLTGTLAFNIIVYIPANTPGMWLIDNQTSGNFNVTVKTNATGSVGINPVQGYITFIFCDGTNVQYADLGNVIAHQVQGVPPGAISAFAMTTPPSGWLVCNGAAVSRTLYAALFAAIGTAWGPGDGANTFNVPNLLGQFLRGWNGTSSGVDANRQFASSQADAYLNHKHTDAGHTHAIPGYPGSAPSAAIPGSPNWYINGGNTTTTQGFADIQMSTTGGTETRPVNYAIQYCIRT